MGKGLRITLIVVGVLVLLRILLPVAIKYGINWALANKVPGYYGYIEDFDLALLRGQYRIQGLHLEKREAENSPPLLKIEHIHVGLSWKGVFQGRLLTRILIAGARVHLLDSTDQEKDQLGSTEAFDWRELYWTLIPFAVEDLRIQESELRFENLDAGLKSELFFSRITATAQNIQNLTKDQGFLPTPLQIEALVQGQTPVLLKGRVNALSRPFAADVDFVLEDFPLTELNPILVSYLPLSFEQGDGSVYAEFATHRGEIRGYVKAFVEKLRVMGARERFLTFPHLGIEFLTGAANRIFRDSEETISTQVEFSGRFDDPQIRTGKALWKALETAYTSAELERKLEDRDFDFPLKTE